MCDAPAAFIFTKRPDITSSATARDYRWAKEQSFFARQPLERAKAVHDAYQSVAVITGVVIDELGNYLGTLSTDLR